MNEAVRALYNSAQRDVIVRASIIADGLLHSTDPPAEDEGPTP
jgi:hypothetical protein